MCVLIASRIIRIKGLSWGKKRTSGRNNQGQITVQYRGGGIKRIYRNVDYFRYNINVYGMIIRVERDIMRTALLGVVCYANGIVSYILMPESLNIGDFVLNSSLFSNNKIGWGVPMSNLEVGQLVHCIQPTTHLPAKYVRTGGNSAKVLSLSNHAYIIKLRSGFIFKSRVPLRVIVGVVSEAKLTSKFNAGKFRLFGWRPHVRGVAKNPVDHPHGGGQGKTSGGRPSVSPKGFYTKGRPTRVKRKKFGIRWSKLT